MNNNNLIFKEEDSKLKHMKKMLSVKPFRETLNSGMCGPASLKIIFAYYGVDKTEKELFRVCGADKNIGTDDKGLKRAAGHLDLRLK